MFFIPLHHKCNRLQTGGSQVFERALCRSPQKPRLDDSSLCCVSTIMSGNEASMVKILRSYFSVFLTGEKKFLAVQEQNLFANLGLLLFCRTFGVCFVIIRQKFLFNSLLTAYNLRLNCDSRVFDFFGYVLCDAQCRHLMTRLVALKQSSCFHVQNCTLSCCSRSALDRQFAPFRVWSRACQLQSARPDLRASVNIQRAPTPIERQTKRPPRARLMHLRPRDDGGDFGCTRLPSLLMRISPLSSGHWRQAAVVVARTSRPNELTPQFGAAALSSAAPAAHSCRKERRLANRAADQ